MTAPSSIERRQRKTKQGDAVLRVVRDTDTFRSAQDVHAALRALGERVGLTTVYRHLQGLAGSGVVDVLLTADGETLYRCCETDGHHHHLVCRRCGASAEIEGPGVEKWAEDAASRYGYTDVSHTLEIFGL